VHRVLAPQIAGDAEARARLRRDRAPVRDVLFRMERTGVLIDAALLAEQGRDLGDARAALEQEAHRSRRAVQPGLAQAALRDPVRADEAAGQKKTATGQPSTDEEVLQELAADYPLPKCCSTIARSRSSSRRTPTSFRRW
jgi:DNA polymerase-1